MNLKLLVKRFIFGIAIGLFVAMICWSYSAYFLVSISLFQGILGCLLLAISCGLVAAISDPDTLLDNFPFL
ncbi:MAG: hypothetical protein QNJ55_21080 [Xenococcus sp. MO_188.B8]|nr:hypothetical protein [Xenococcus sp. MO_188.B8]